MLNNLENEISQKHLLVPQRVDSFNLDDFCSKIQKEKPEGLDLSQTLFLNVKAIQFIEAYAANFATGDKKLLLIGARERIKKQIRLFASTENMTAISTWEWRKEVNTNIVGEA